MSYHYNNTYTMINNNHCKINKYEIKTQLYDKYIRIISLNMKTSDYYETIIKEEDLESIEENFDIINIHDLYMVINDSLSSDEYYTCKIYCVEDVFVIDINQTIKDMSDNIKIILDINKKKSSEIYKRSNNVLFDGWGDFFDKFEEFLDR
jgi:hypothetical protein